MALFEVKIGDATYDVEAPDERTAWRWANATHSKAPTKAQEPAKRAAPSDTAVAANASNKAIAGLPDAILNAPNRVMNLGRAAFGTAAAAAGRPDLAPELTPDPNYAGRAMGALGLTSDAAEPANGRQRIIDATIQAGVGTAVSPASSVRQAVTNVVTGLAGGTAAGVTKEATGSDEAAAVAGMLTPLGVQAGVRAGQERVADAVLRREQNAVRDQTLADGQNLGYVLPPSEVRGNSGARYWINRRLESIAGKAALDQEASIRNQSVTNDVARREAGLQRNEPLARANLEASRDRQAQPYRDVAALPPQTLTSPPFPNAAQTLEELREARRQSQLHYAHYDRQRDPQALARAEAEGQRATNLERVIDTVASQSGNQTLLHELRQARMGIAKNHDVDRVLNLGSGDASARLFGSALDRGAPLTGDLAVTGRFAEAFPRVNRDGSSVPTPGVSKSEAITGALLGAGGAAAAGPAGLLAGGLPLVSGPVRSMVLSRPYQRYMATPNYSVGMAARGLNEMSALGPEAQAIQAALLARALEERAQ